MRTTSTVVAACLMTAALAGCGGGDAEPVPVVRPAWKAVHPLPYWPGPPALVRTQAELNAIWSTALPDYPGLPVTLPPEPTVDFATHALVWVPGSVPDSCPAFGIRSISRQGFDYTIEWGYQRFGMGGSADCLLTAVNLLALALLPQPVNTATFVRRDLCYAERTGTYETCL